MHREITAFLQYVQDILAKFLGIFATCRAFLQHCIATTRPGFEVGYTIKRRGRSEM